MNWFNNLKISTKLILSFLLVAIISGVVGFMGIQGLNELKASLSRVNNQMLPSIQTLLTINQAQTAVKAAERTIFSQLENKEQYDKEVGNIANEYNTAEEAWAVYESLDYTEEEKKIWDQFTVAWTNWKSSQQEFMNLVAEYYTYDPQDTELIRDIEEKITNQTLNITSKSFRETETLLNSIIDINEKEAVKEENRATQAGKTVTIILLSVIGAGLLISITLGIFIARRISKPIISMVEAANGLAQGDVSINIKVDTKDEVGSLATAFNNMIENIRKQAFAVEKIASGDLTAEVEVRSAKDLLGIKLSEMIRENNNILNNIAAASEQVASGSKQVANSSMALSQGATEQASAIEELTASLEEISSQTKLNAQNANQANELAENAKVNAINGNDQMKEMLKAMEEINESSTSISKIIKVIDDIAFQTNILALNAAVEAARAGQHGKGFAVVAEEVRNLAARSANAAKETTDMIEGSIKKVEDGTKIAKGTADALVNIVSGVDKVAVLVEDIAQASNEQASGIAQINQGIIQVSQVVQSNSATSEESAAASEELTSQAILLKEMVGKFKLKRSVKSYGKMEDISPEVLNLLENISDKGYKSNAAYIASSGDGITTSKQQIVLSDNEFGKY